MRLPKEPMAPISSDEIPRGEDWGYQLKWDGVRLLAAVDNGRIQLYSRKMLRKDSVYPEIMQLLQPMKGTYLIDGEAVAFNMETQKPDFPRILQRERSGGAAGSVKSGGGHMVLYVMFDLLHEGDQDLSGLPFSERHRRLLALFPTKQPAMFVSDLFYDSDALWRWIEERGWEGIVSKRLSSVYAEGKNHKDWFKKKTAIVEQVRIAGLTIRSGQVASFVMVRDGLFFGKASLGLNVAMKRELLDWGRRHERAESWFHPLPEELKGEQVLWLKDGFPCTVTGLEITAAGLLRHPKLVSYELGPERVIHV
ncbi:DNA ligase [Paenibacillus hamazuiensis]|uniref:ATP-dependent DNA ligase n=1 Tax=Paenibacillus hamazuiensis TaxID=2936508 RepID=UPI00200BBA6D|nr:DNA ligase [Paenibacillus hamazuiensis]